MLSSSLVIHSHLEHILLSLSPSEVCMEKGDWYPVTRSSYSTYPFKVDCCGKDSAYKLAAAIHVYDPSSNSWEVISHMAVPWSDCYAAVLPDYQLVLVGGCIDNDDTTTNTVEIATSL